MFAPPHHPQELLQRRPVSTPPDGDLDFELEEDLEDSSESWLVCRACRHRVTHHGARIGIEGRHVHRRTNPAGIDFEFACFGEAPGAARVGEATGEHSWFSGYRWRFAVCRGCGSHLGWSFEGRDPAFWGLITDRLSEAD